MHELRAKQIEGLLFTLGKPIEHSDLAKYLGCSTEEVEEAINHLLSRTSSGVVVISDGTYAELRTSPEVAELVELVRRAEVARDIGRAGLEVLAAILYRGPLSRAEIDFIRGVNSSQTLRTLTTRGLVRKVQHTRQQGEVGSRSSFVYESTTELLATLGATHPRDLPDFDTTRSKLTELEAAYRKNEGRDEDAV